MTTAGWWDVWHLAVAVVARQSPFMQILYATGAALIVVMAVEGLRTSLLAIWRAHKTPPLPAPPPSQAVTLGMAAAPPSKSFSARAASQAARRPKTQAVFPRTTRSPRPKIRRHGMLDVAPAGEFTQSQVSTPEPLTDAL